MWYTNGEGEEVRAEHSFVAPLRTWGPKWILTAERYSMGFQLRRSCRLWSRKGGVLKQWWDGLFVLSGHEWGSVRQSCCFG